MSLSSSKELFKNVGVYVLIMALAVLLAFNYQLFIVENGFAPAGLNGIATMVQYKTGFSIGYMALLINVPLCVFAFFLVDRKFAVRTLVFCVVYSVVYLYLQQLGLHEFQYDAQGHDTIFPVILSGVVSGFVNGTCVRLLASTGGTDILSKYISKRNPELNFFWVTFLLNAMVAAVSFFVYAEAGEQGIVYDYKPVCLCILYCFVVSFVGSYIIKGTKTATKFTVITDHAEEIAEEVLAVLHHGCTRMEASGSYTHGQKSVLICVINRHQAVDFQNILKKYDKTFSFSETVSETYGNFKRIK